MNSALDLLIVIINYKTGGMVIDCLKTVIPQLTNDRRVVVVDNDSADGSAEAIQEWINSSDSSQYVDFIQSDRNTGFSGGNNIGIRSRKANYYLLLNSDTLLRDNALNTMLATAKENPDAGLISPRLEWLDEKPQISCFRFHNPVAEFIYAASTGPITSMFKKWEVAIPVIDEISFPQWTSFACVLVKGEMVESIGLMDEGYFLYYEDVDYCRTAAQNGWHIVNNPKARVVHLRGGSSDVKSNISFKKRVPRYYYASRTRYFAKFYGRAGLLLANTLWLSGRCISLSRELIGKKESTACEKQHSDIWTNFMHPYDPYRK